MTCDSVDGLLGAYFDEELDPTQRAEIAAHLETCAGCAAGLEKIRMMSAAIRTPENYFTAPAHLEARVRASLRDRPARQFTWWGKSGWSWAAVAACALLSAALAWTLLSHRSTNNLEVSVASEVLSSHVRSLQSNHLLDVPSTDQHTVKPWFDGKLDFSPEVKDLAASGFRLIGGRLDYLQGRPVAALVFQRRLHMINVFVWPSNESASPPRAAPGGNGYNEVHWIAGGMTWWAVADISAAELEQLGSLYLK